jgi:uncharacterized protein YdeI (YjbR/CyaY-like superfamily)
MNPKVDWYFSKAGQWQKEFEKLRTIVLDCLPTGQAGDLTEELKWGHPCYSFEKSNIVLMHGFKEYCALLFFKGALLKDAKGILVQQTKNVQAARQIRFTSAKEIVKLKTIVKAYVKEAINSEKTGLKVELKKTSEFNMPNEFRTVLKEMPELKTAFFKLTPGRQRGYLLYFSSAKQAKTREARIEKHLQQILEGKGLED